MEERETQQRSRHLMAPPAGGEMRRGLLAPDPDLPAPSLRAVLWAVAAVLAAVVYVATTAFSA